MEVSKAFFASSQLSATKPLLLFSFLFPLIPHPPPHTHTHTQRVEILRAAVQLIYKLKEELAGLLLLRNEPNESNKYNRTTHCTTRYPVANRPTVTGSQTKDTAHQRILTVYSKFTNASYSFHLKQLQLEVYFSSRKQSSAAMYIYETV